MDSTIRAYAAGIIDGEGCITVGYKKRQDVCMLYVGVTQATPTIPNWLSKNFGNKVTEYIRARGLVAYRWQKYGTNAVMFIMLIKPYLTEKLSQAEWAMLYPIVLRGQRLTVEEKNTQLQIRDALSHLNSNKGGSRNYVRP